MLAGTLAVTALYLLLNAVFVYAAPTAELAGPVRLRLREWAPLLALLALLAYLGDVAYRRWPRSSVA